MDSCYIILLLFILCIHVAFIVTVTALKCLYIIPVMFFTVEMSEDILSRLLTVAKHFSLVAVGLFSTYKSCFKKTTISCEFFKKRINVIISPALSA